MSRHAFVFGAVFCLLAVALGAFGAHGLKTQISAESLEVFKTGALYQFMHGLALIVIGAIRLTSFDRRLDHASLCFLVGIVVFSGSLYGLAISGLKILGAIAPIGGSLMMIGWIFLTLAGRALTSREASA